MKAILRTIAMAGVVLVSLPITPVSGRETVVEYRCSLRSTGEHSSPDSDAAVVKVLQLAASEQLQLPKGADPKDQFMLCFRSLLVPSVNDVKVLEAGFKLFIGAAEEGTDEPRIAVLEGSKPNIVFHVVKGTATRSEASMTEKVLKAINGG